MLLINLTKWNDLVKTGTMFWRGNVKINGQTWASKRHHDTPKRVRVDKFTGFTVFHTDSNQDTIHCTGAR